MQPLMSSMQSARNWHIWYHGIQRMPRDRLEKWNAHRSSRHRSGSQTQQLFPHKGKENGKTTFFRDQQRHCDRHMLPLRQKRLARTIKILPSLEKHGTEVCLALRGTPLLMRTGKHEEELEDREHSYHQRDRSSQRAGATHNEGFHPRRNTRRDQRKKHMRFKDHTLQNIWSWERKTTKIEKEWPMTRSRGRN